MPIGSLIRTVATLGFTLKTLSGEVARISFSDLTSAPSDTAVNTLRSAIAAATNAAVEAQNFTATGLYSLTALNDEAYSAAQVKLLLVYQDPVQGVTRRVELPAPDALLLGSDGVTVDRSNPTFVSLNNAILGVIGSGFELRRGFLTSRTRRVRPANLNLYALAEEPEPPLVDSGPGLPTP